MHGKKYPNSKTSEIRRLLTLSKTKFSSIQLQFPITTEWKISICYWFNAKRATPPVQAVKKLFSGLLWVCTSQRVRRISLNFYNVAKLSYIEFRKNKRQTKKLANNRNHYGNHNPCLPLFFRSHLNGRNLYSLKKSSEKFYVYIWMKNVFVLSLKTFILT